MEIDFLDELLKEAEEKEEEQTEAYYDLLLMGIGSFRLRSNIISTRLRKSAR